MEEMLAGARLSIDFDISDSTSMELTYDYQKG